MLTFLKTLPLTGKIFSLIAIVIALIVMIFFTSSCGVTKAVVKGSAEGAVTEIKITTNNPTSVTTTPNVELKNPINDESK